MLVSIHRVFTLLRQKGGARNDGFVPNDVSAKGDSMNRIFSLLFILAWILPPSLAAAEPRAIGALADLTGSFARLGEDCRSGYEVAIQSSEVKRKVIFGDNQNDPKAGISEFRRMVDSERVSLIVTSRSPVALALNSLSAREELPLIGVVGHPRFIAENPFAIRVFPSASDEAKVLVQSVDREGQRIAIISLEDEYFLGLRDAFVKNLRNSVVVFNETLSPKDLEFSTLIAKMKSKSPNAILINAGPNQIPILIHKMRELGVDSSLYSNFLAGAQDVISALGRDGDGLRYAELDYERPRFVEAFTRIVGKKPLSPLSYACYVAMTYAIELPERERSSESLARTKEINTLDGPIAFLHREGQFPVVLKTLQNGKPVKSDLESLHATSNWERREWGADYSVAAEWLGLSFP